MKTGSPSAADQTLPPAEPMTTGCSAAAAVTPPTASHPALPFVMPVSCWIPGLARRASSSARCQVRPPSADIQAAGKPFALPTAICRLP